MSSNIQNQKNGTVPMEKFSFTAHRDPIFQTTLLEESTPATYSIPTTVHNYGPRGAGRLGVVVGSDAVVAAFNLTFVIKDIDGLIIGSNVTQTIPETPAGTSVITALNLTQQQILRGQTISFVGDVILAAGGTKLVVKLAEQSPEQEIAVSGDGIATEATLAALKTLADTTGLKILPADVADLKLVTEASAADIKAGVGAPTDAPLAGLTPEDATPRSSVALLKHIANLLISGLFSGANSIATIWNDVWDSVGHAIKVAVSNPPWTRVSGPTALIGAAQGITNAWADLGPEVATSGYNYADVMLTKTPGTSTDISLRALRKDSSGGAIEVPIQWEAVAAGVVVLDDKVWMLNDDATPCLIRIDLRNSVPYLQLQVKDAADGTGTIDTATITLGY